MGFVEEGFFFVEELGEMVSIESFYHVRKMLESEGLRQKPSTCKPSNLQLVYRFLQRLAENLQPVIDLLTRYIQRRDPTPTHKIVIPLTQAEVPRAFPLLR